MSLAEALETSAQALRDGEGPEVLDGALVALLGALARELDGARAISRAADNALRTAQREYPDDPVLHEQITALRAALAERTALDKLSQRLLAGYVELGLTPRSRGAVKAPVAAGPQGRLGELRAVRRTS